MALKYYIEYLDPEDVSYRIDISDPNFSGEAIKVGGYATIEYSEVDDLHTVIRGSSLFLYLEAETAETFFDLYTQKDRTISVVLTRGSQVIFSGWILQEGFYQEWVGDRWELKLECNDGLSDLENLAYTEIEISGTSRVRGNLILARCLESTGLELPINVSISTRASGVVSPFETLYDISFDQRRLIKEDGDTPMSCKEVLESILGIFRAILFQYNGEWYVIELRNITQGNVTFHKYDYDGSTITSTNVVPVGGDLGSHINGAYPHHSGENQKIEANPAVSSSRVSFDYGVLKSIIQNPELDFTFDLSGDVVIDDWTVDNQSVLTQSVAGSLRVDNDFFGGNLIAFHSDYSPETTIESGNVIDVMVKGFSPKKGSMRYTVTLYDGSDTYYLDGAGRWNQNDFKVIVLDGDGNINDTHTSDPAPVDGDVQLSVYRGRATTPYPSTWSYFGFGLSAANSIESEDHTFRRTDKPSSYSADTETVSFGDSVEDAFNGTIYISGASVVPTELWLNTISGVSKPILEDMGDKFMTYNYFMSRVFSGDIYGFFSYLSCVNISGISGDFLFLKYEHNTKTNVGSVVLRQINKTFQDPYNVSYRKYVKDNRFNQKSTI